jgi:LysR family pca operon transcriptional activator
MHGSEMLNIGALLGVAAQFMPRAVREFREHHNSRLRIITAPTRTMLDQLRLGDLNLVVGRLAPTKEMQGLSFIHLYSEQLVFVVRTGHPLAGQPTFDLSLLGHLTLIMPTADGVMRRVIDRFLLAHGVGAMQNAIEARSSAFCRQFLRDSDAVWMVSRGVVEHEIEDGTLSMLSVDTSETQGAVGLTVRSDTDPSPTLRMMMDIITRVAAEYPHP